MSDDRQSRNAVDDVATETVDEETGQQEHEAEATRRHGEGFASRELAEKGKESKENVQEEEGA